MRRLGYTPLEMEINSGVLSNISHQLTVAVTISTVPCGEKDQEKEELHIALITCKRLQSETQTYYDCTTFVSKITAISYIKILLLLFFSISEN